MNTLFNFERFGLLIKRFFFERGSHELLFWGITVLVFTLIGNFQTQIIFLMITGSFFASKFFSEIHSKTQGVNYFMIPATQLEKLLSAIIISVVYFFILFIITYVIGNLMHTYLNNLLADYFMAFSHKTLQWSLFQSNFSGITPLKIVFITFVISQAIFLLGSIYFKRTVFLKTLFSVFVMLFALTNIEVILYAIFVEGRLELSVYIPAEILMKNLNVKFYEVILNVLLYSSAPFLWVVSYFRLTEKEV